MDRRALTLQPRSQDIDGIDGTCAERPADGADTSRHDVTRRGVFFVTVAGFGVAGGDELFEVFEGGEVEGTVGEHADEAHRETSVEGADAGCGPHFLGGGDDEAVAVEAALDGLALHATGL